MYEIINKVCLNPTVTRMDILAPLVAKKAEPGQFIILRVDDDGERIPLTVADYDREAGTVTIIFQIVGATTEALNRKEKGDFIADFVGPLGKKTHTEGLKKLPLLVAVLVALLHIHLLKNFLRWALTQQQSQVLETKTL